MALSGWLVLEETIEDLKYFYYRHLLRLIIPLVVYVIGYQLYYSGGTSISMRAILSGDGPTHTWYVYTMLAMYLLAPFLSGRVRALSKMRLTALLGIIFFLDTGCA